MHRVSAGLALGVALAITGCGSSTGSSSPSSSSSSSAAASTQAPSATAAGATTATGGVNPNVPETLPPGDIPDTVAYVPYAVPGHKLTLSTPEGWSRQSSSKGVTFTDKLNTIQLIDTPAAGTTITTPAGRAEVPKIAAGVKGFKLQSVTTVSRPAGLAVRIAYLGYSQPNPVTGKFGVLAFERYEFVHKGRKLVLLLSAPNGSDNVDPWRKVTSSLKFTS